MPQARRGASGFFARRWVLGPLNSERRERGLTQRRKRPPRLSDNPFCGCGTTIDAAEKLGRQWIGIDITQLAVTLIKNRLLDTYGSRMKFVSGSAQVGRALRCPPPNMPKPPNHPTARTE